MNHNIRIACLVPCYNAVLFIDRFLESYTNQTIPFDELIFYDDASIDSTADYLEAKGYKVLRGRINRGPSFGRNRMIEHTTADWVHFHDADDILDSFFVEKMKANISSNHVQLLCDCGIKDKFGNKKRELATYSIESNEDAVEYFLNNIGLAIVGLYNRQFLFEHNIFFREHLRFNEDPDFHIRLANAGAKFKSVNETLVYVIGHVESSSMKYWWSCISNQVYCYNDYLQTLPIKYKQILARRVADIAYYALRSKRPLVAHRAIYSLRENFNNQFFFSKRSINILYKIVGPKIFFYLIKTASRFI